MKNLSVTSLSLVSLAFASTALAQSGRTAARAIATKSLAQYKAAEKTKSKRLAVFDDLDFNVYSNQKWGLFKHSHAENILVHYPDGHTSKGLANHIEELKGLFVYAPDTKIKVHPVRLGDGEYTSVIGVMEGTFSKPMPMGGGKTIAPTGKHFKLMMCTVGHWTNAGVMDEEFLFWDNAAFAKQMGLGQ